MNIVNSSKQLLPVLESDPLYRDISHTLEKLFSSGGTVQSFLAYKKRLSYSQSFTKEEHNFLSDVRNRLLTMGHSSTADVIADYIATVEKFELIGKTLAGSPVFKTMLPVILEIIEPLVINDTHFQYERPGKDDLFAIKTQQDYHRSLELLSLAMGTDDGVVPCASDRALLQGLSFLLLARDIRILQVSDHRTFGRLRNTNLSSYGDAIEDRLKMDQRQAFETVTYFIGEWRTQMFDIGQGFDGVDSAVKKLSKVLDGLVSDVRRESEEQGDTSKVCPSSLLGL